MKNKKLFSLSKISEGKKIGRLEGKLEKSPRPFGERFKFKKLTFPLLQHSLVGEGAVVSKPKASLTTAGEVSVRGYKIAFTLAEVLITLGVIGVVAAMTLPTLIKNYQKHVWVNQLKKSINTIENGYRSAMAKDGVDNLADTELFNSLNGFGYVFDTFSKNQNFENKLKEYFNILFIVDIDREDYKFLTGNTAPFRMGREIVFYDGSSILLNITGPYFTVFYKDTGESSVLIDVNSSNKGPNQFGRDVFYFNFSNHGNIKNSSNDCTEGNKVGVMGCGSYLLQNGWKMDY